MGFKERFCTCLIQSFEKYSRIKHLELSLFIKGENTVKMMISPAQYECGRDVAITESPPPSSLNSPSLTILSFSPFNKSYFLPSEHYFLHTYQDFQPSYQDFQDFQPSYQDFQPSYQDFQPSYQDFPAHQHLYCLPLLQTTSKLLLPPFPLIQPPFCHHLVELSKICRFSFFWFPSRI